VTPHSSSAHKSTKGKATSTVQGGVNPFKTTTNHPPSATHPHSHTVIVNGSTIAPHPPIETSQPDIAPPASHPPSGWIIFLEVVGALLGLAVVAALGRCFWSYRRTPRYRQTRRQESIQEIRRELMENRLRRIFHRNPPPPYESAPDYETAVSSTDLSSALQNPPPATMQEVRSHPVTPPIFSPHPEFTPMERPYLPPSR
jgi:hypothetical protein